MYIIRVCTHFLDQFHRAALKNYRGPELEQPGNKAACMCIYTLYISYVGSEDCDIHLADIVRSLTGV